MRFTLRNPRKYFVLCVCVFFVRVFFGGGGEAFPFS